MSDPDVRLFKFLRMYCEATSIAVMGLGFLVLYGLAFHSEFLISVLPGLFTMKANTALGLVFSGISLCLLLPGESRTLRGQIARFLALLVTSTGAVTLSEHLFGLNLRIDQLLFVDARGSVGASTPGRMAPMTAMAFLAIGLALMLLDWKTRGGHRPSQVLSLWAGLVAMMTICGFIYHATALYTILPYRRVALHTAIALSMLSIAVFFARPRTGIAGDLTSEGSGSVMARRFLPAVFVFPIFLGWIFLQGQRAGLFGAELGLALYTASNVIVFIVLVWLSARKMNVEYSQRSRAEVEIRELNAELEGRVAERTKILEQQAAVLTEQSALLDLAHDAVIVRDMDRRIVFWNRGAERMYGWPAKLTVGKIAIELLKEEFPQPIEEIEAQLLQLGHWEEEVIHYTRDGIRLNVESRWALQRDANGVPGRILIINNDITDRKQDESKLLSLTERLSLATAVAKVGVWERNLASNTLIWDATMFEIYGFPTIVPMAYEKWFATVYPKDRPAVEATLRRVMDEKDQGSMEFRITLPDGAVRNISAVVGVILDEHANVVRIIGVNMDVTERRVAEETLRKSEAHQAYSSQHDFLTGLPNRILLNDRISQAIVLALRHKKQIAVLFLDLDGFKHINDFLGHSIGDKLLQSVAARLSACVRKSDTVSRQGGDEFVILLPEVTHAADVAISAAKIIAELKKAHTIGEHRLRVTGSIGLCTCPDNGEDAETLIKNADTAMYHAKQCGRDNYQFFRPDMNLQAVERQSLECQLRYALERQELLVHYQPKVNLKTGAITSVEALVRWQHPERGLLLPGQFLTIAEDAGMIVAIGEWVLREACRQTREWLDAGLLAVPVAVNISPLEFQSEQFLEGVQAALKNTCLDPRYLELELTETVLMRHAESTAYALGQLKAIGVRLAVDDFGAGYSSLSYLTRFPIDTLKLDRSFVHNIIDSSDAAIVVSAVISMGNSLKHRVIAEGVETQEQLAFLQAHGCDEGQGYYFSRPVVAQQFAKLLQTGISATVWN